MPGCGSVVGARGRSLLRAHLGRPPVRSLGWIASAKARVASTPHAVEQPRVATDPGETAPQAAQHADIIVYADFAIVKHNSGGGVVNALD